MPPIQRSAFSLFFRKTPPALTDVTKMISSRIIAITPPIAIAPIRMGIQTKSASSSLGIANRTTFGAIGTSSPVFLFRIENG